MSKKTEYGEWLSTQIVNQDAEIEVLRDKAESGAYEAESGYYSAIAVLQLERDQTALKLQGIAGTSDSEWQDVKAGSEDVMDEVRSMFQDAITKIR